MKRPKILLLQARDADDPMADHERLCFVRQAGLQPEQIDIHDLVQGPPRDAVVARYDALFVGGAGDYYVSKRNLPRFDEVIAFFADLTETGRPMFASCFGFHCLVHALGGEIINDNPNTEVGTYPLTLTDAGAADELFRILPRVFNAQEGHKDRADRLPPGVDNLASSERSPLQAFRIPGQPIWATQFHPELDQEANLHRFHHYLRGYSAVLSEEDRRTALSRFQESPETSRLLPAFLRLVLG